MPVFDNMQGMPEVQANAYEASEASFKLGKVLAQAANGLECFDCEDYRQSNVDLAGMLECSDLFSHFLNYGQFEGRPHRCAHVQSTCFVSVGFGQQCDDHHSLLALPLPLAFLDVAWLPG